MSLLAAASAWWTGHISAATMQTQLVDPVNALDTRTAQGAPIAVTYDAAFDAPGGSNADIRLDGNGDVLLEGQFTKDSGNLTAAAFTTVGTIPSAYAPRLEVRVRITSGSGDIDGVLWIAQGDTTVKIYAPTGSAVPKYYVSGIRWST